VLHQLGIILLHCSNTTLNILSQFDLFCKENEGFFGMKSITLVFLTLVTDNDFMNSSRNL